MDVLQDSKYTHFLRYLYFACKKRRQSFIWYVSKVFRKANILTLWYVKVRPRIRGKYISFTENFAYVINEWSLDKI